MKRSRVVFGSALFLTGFVFVFDSLTVTGFSVVSRVFFENNFLYSIGGFGLMMVGIAVVGSGLEKRVLGKGLDVNVHFVRHGEKDNEGLLTHEGANQGRKYGENLKGDVVKGYFSPISRVVETVYEAVRASGGKRMKMRERGAYLADVDEFSDEFNEAFKKDPKGVLNQWYRDGCEKYDAETVTSEEVASRFAHVLNNYIKMSGKLKEGSSVDLVNGTHEAFPETLLHEVMIRRNKEGKKVRGFDKIEDIGGTLGYAEGMEFKIHRNNEGVVDVGLEFRGKKYDVDMERLGELVGKYREGRKKD